MTINNMTIVHKGEKLLGIVMKTLRVSNNDTHKMKNVETPAENSSGFLRPNFCTHSTEKPVPMVLISPIPIATIVGCPIDISSRSVTA